MPKGKKTCPSCGIENGARTSVCGCGHHFSKEAKKPHVINETAKALAQHDPSPATVVNFSQDCLRPLNSSRFFSSTISCPLIHTPAGHCPVKPQGFTRKNWPEGPASEDCISAWALKVFSSDNLLPEAVVYWIHEFWDMNLNGGVEYRRVKDIVIKTLCGSSYQEVP